MSVEALVPVADVLALCVQMERLAGDMYRELADQQRRRADLYKLWSKTAREEDMHAAQFERALTMESAVGEVHVRREDVEALVTHVQEILERVRRVRPSPVDSLRLAVKLEHAMAQMHLGHVASFSEPSVQRLFDSMAKADLGHIAALEEQLRSELEPRSSGP